MVLKALFLAIILESRSPSRCISYFNADAPNRISPALGRLKESSVVVSRFLFSNGTVLILEREIITVYVDGLRFGSASHPRMGAGCHRK